MTVNFIWQSYLHLLCLPKNAHGSGELSEYEKKRLENIRQNSEFFDGLQLTEVMTLLLCHFAFAYTHIFIYLYIYIIWGILSHQKCRATFTDYTSKYQGISHFSKEEWQYQYIRADCIIKCILIVCVGDLVPLYLLCWNPAWEVQVIVLCSWTKYTHTVPLFTQEFKWVLANCQRILMKFWGKGGGGGLTME